MYLSWVSPLIKYCMAFAKRYCPSKGQRTHIRWNRKPTSRIELVTRMFRQWSTDSQQKDNFLIGIRCAWYVHACVYMYGNDVVVLWNELESWRIDNWTPKAIFNWICKHLFSSDCFMMAFRLQPCLLCHYASKMTHISFKDSDNRLVKIQHCSIEVYTCKSVEMVFCLLAYSSTSAINSKSRSIYIYIVPTVITYSSVSVTIH